jgi:hypothetical protein
LGETDCLYDLITYECVWIEIPIPGGFNLLVSNHYFPPNMDNKVIENYFNSFQNKPNAQSFRVVLFGDFNVPGYDWVSGLPHANTHYYTKLRGKVIQNAACFLGLSQHNLTTQSNNLIHFVFANFSDVPLSTPSIRLLS